MIKHQEAFAFLDDLMPLGFDQFAERLNPARILGVQFTADFQCSPVRRDTLAPFVFGFDCGMRGDPGKDAGGDRAGHLGIVLTGESRPEFVDGDEFSLGNFLHQSIHFSGSWDNERGTFPLSPIFRGDLYYFGQVLVIGEFLPPSLARFHGLLDLYA